MKIAFVVPRSNHIKVIGPVWEEAKRRGHEVVAVVPPADIKGAGALAHVEAELGGPVQSQLGLAEAGFDWAIAMGLRTAPDLRRQTRPMLKWAALDHVGDNLTFLLEGDSTANWELVTTLSETAKQFAVAETGGYFGNDMIPIGYPELDQLSLPTMTRAACRAKWSLSSGQFVVLFGLAARPIRLGRVRRWWFAMIRYRRIMASLRQWCDRSGAVLVAKTRIKHRDPAWLARYCDRIVGDEAFYPFTTLELLRAADLYVGFASAMAIEACAVGMRQVHLHGWPPHQAEWPAAWPLKQRFFLEPNGLWNCPGSGQYAAWHGHLETLPEVLSRAAAWKTATGGAYERWAGPLDGKAAARLLDLMEARC